MNNGTKAGRKGRYGHLTGAVSSSQAKCKLGRGMWICIKKPESSNLIGWQLEGCSILIYSAWQGLSTCKTRFKNPLPHSPPQNVDVYRSKVAFLLQILFVLFTLLFYDVVSCHSYLIQCIGKAVFHDCGISRVSLNFGFLHWYWWILSRGQYSPISV